MNSMYILIIQKIHLEDKNEAELNLFNQEHDQKFQELIKRHEDIEQETLRNFDQEIESIIQKYNQIVIEAKPSAEILNQNKILEKYVKQKE